MKRTSPPSLSLLALPLVAVLAACGTEGSEDGDAAGAAAPSSAPSATEASAPQPRLAVTSEDGVLVVDATNGDVLLEEPLEGFVRLSHAGDGRHVMVARSGGFTALDLGSWTDAHGDHGHSWMREPELTDFTIEATEPGHVVVHHGRTTTFDDGTATVTAFDPALLADLATDGPPALDTWVLDEAHHGVAVQEGHGNLLHTVGDEESRSGVRVASAAGAELAASDQCPGVHGEAVVGEVVAFGCEDGVLLVDGTDITKVASPDPYGRSGNLAGHDTSPFLLGDYKTDPDAELERPTRVAAVDTRTGRLRLVDLGASYSFRSLGRTPSGDGLVLGTDGALHVVDLARGRVASSLPVVAPWREPLDWREPRPTLHVAGGTAYVSEPASDAVHVVDLERGEVTDTLELPSTPNELVAVTG